MNGGFGHRVDGQHTVEACEIGCQSFPSFDARYPAGRCIWKLHYPVGRHHLDETVGVLIDAGAESSFQHAGKAREVDCIFCHLPISLFFGWNGNVPS
jgi:hypothetical protein